MRNLSRHKWEWVLALLIALVVVIVIVQCGEAEQTDGGVDLVNCVTHEDCPTGFSCILSQGICGKDPYAYECLSEADCSPGYSCYVPFGSEDGKGKCIPAPGEDGDEDQPDTCENELDCPDDYLCVNGTCQYCCPVCKDENDCWPGQCCNNERCGECPVEVDGDDEPIIDGDEDEEEPVIPGCENTCQRSGDCLVEGQVCGPGGCCVDSCATTGCPEGQTCNPNNGYCEWCDPVCPQGQCCNYHQDFWYCGSCCVPPCPEGEACQGGRCIQLACPTCESGYRCGPDTGYICVPTGPVVDGDVDRSPGFGECLPANAACIEGVDECCSGTCLMGTCL